MAARTTKTDTATLLAQLRALLEMTGSEIQVAETRLGQARTEAVRAELKRNAKDGRARAEQIEKAIRRLGGYPTLVRPILGRAAGAVKTLTEQAEPFDEALLGDLALENDLLDRSRYVKALAVAAGDKDVQALADRLIDAHSSTVEWLTTVLAEDALGGPAALARTPMQSVAGGVVKLVNLPMTWSQRRAERAADAVRTARESLTQTVSQWVNRSARSGEVAAKTLSGARDSALHTAEEVSREQGAGRTADAIHSARGAAGVLQADELPLRGYDELNVNEAASAIKDLTKPADIRVIIAYEEAHKDRAGVVSAAQSRLAAIAQETVGIT